MYAFSSPQVAQLFIIPVHDIWGSWTQWSALRMMQAHSFEKWIPLLSELWDCRKNALRRNINCCQLHYFSCRLLKFIHLSVDAKNEMGCGNSSYSWFSLRQQSAGVRGIWRWGSTHYIEEDFFGCCMWARLFFCARSLRRLPLFPTRSSAETKGKCEYPCLTRFRPSFVKSYSIWTFGL